MAYTAHDLILCRSDLGDGGWSLHSPDATDEEIAKGDDLYLLTGEATEVNGEWDRPNEQDYLNAFSLWKAIRRI